MKIRILVVILLAINLIAEAQISRYPQNYFMYPIKPGEITSLTGNMGELRSNHYHGGIDIRTGWADGQPVYAAADGYVTRVQVDTRGYGNMIYLRHPNGYITTYAHLKEFSSPLAEYVRKKQYEQETFEIDFFLKKGEITFKKGDIIAQSGNTGGSGGPHLHFEVRDSSNNMLNPMLFGFKEIEDTQNPYFGKVAVRSLDINGRVNDAFGRVEMMSKRIDKDEFKVVKPVRVQGAIGLEVVARDRINNGSQRAGITCLEMRLDGKEIFYHSLETFKFEESGAINVLIDYEHYWKSGERFQRCYLADGHPNKKSQPTSKMGRIVITDTLPHMLMISAFDAYKNGTHLSMVLQGAKPKYNRKLPPLLYKTSKPYIKHQVFENTLKMSVLRCPSESMTLFSGKKTYPISLSYVKDQEAVFLWDMRKGLPDSVKFDTLTAHRFHFKQLIPPNKAIQFLLGALRLKTNEVSLFDTLYLETKHDEEDESITISNPLVPLVSAIRLGFKPMKDVLNRAKTAVYMESFSKRLRYVGGLWEGDGINFMAKNLGKFRLATDTIPPKIKPAVINRNAVRVHIYDNLSGVKSFRATLNGKWILMSYEHKQNLLYAEPLTKGTPIEGEFILTVTDNAGNSQELRRNIK